MTLKQAICEYLQEQLNNEWVNLKGIGSDKPFVFTTDFTYDTGDMTLFDENGNPIFTKYNSFERYIPCSVFSIIGDRVSIPNIQILDTIIPIEMLVDNGKLDDVLICLETFQDNINAKPIVLTAFYKGQDVEYNIIMTFNMPDDDTFRNIQGMNAKIVDFQISALVTTEVYFGNSITYELSLDNGNTFTPLIRTDNSNSRVVENHTQQIINDDFSKATPKFNVWGMPITAIISKNTPLKDLIVLTDFPEMYNILGYSENPLYNAVLKIHYNDLGFPFLVDIPIWRDTTVGVYTGNEIYYRPINWDRISQYCTISGYYAVNVGDYETNVSLIDSHNYGWRLFTGAIISDDQIKNWKIIPADGYFKHGPYLNGSFYVGETITCTALYVDDTCELKYRWYRYWYP